MVNLIRRFQQPLMLFITVIVIIAFVWLYNNNSRVDRFGSDRFGSIYGRNISQTEFMRGSKKFELARDLSMFELLQPLAGNAQTLDQATENFVWNNLVLRHEAEQLGIQPQDSEVEEFIKQMPVFQNNGTYDPSRYASVARNVLPSRGLSEDQLFDVIRDSLKMRRIQQVLGSTAPASPSEVRTSFELTHQKTEASVIRLKLEDFLKEVKLTDEDVKKAFEERKANLNAPEKRKVKYVAFTVANQEKPLVGKERMDAMQKLADQAGEFAVQMTEKGATFEGVAEKLKAKVETSPEFSQEEPPVQLGQADRVAEAVFRLTKEEPNSDAIATENGYYVTQLQDIVPARPLTFEEAKSKLETELKDERAKEALNLKAAEIRNKVIAAVKTGKSFEEAAKEAGANAEKFPTFSLAEPKLDQPDAREVMITARDLATGETSEVRGTPAGALIVHVDNRQPVDEAAFEKQKAMITENIERGRREVLFFEWLKQRRTQANVLVPQRRA